MEAGQQESHMRNIIQTLERNVKEVRYGTVGVEIHIHDGRIVKAVFNTANVTVQRLTKNTNEANNRSGDFLEQGEVTLRKKDSV
jgi:hypothetical protein